MQALVILLLFLLSNSAHGIDFEDVTVSTLEGLKFSGDVADMKMQSDGNSLLVLVSHSIWSFDPIAKTKLQIAGSGSKGYIEGIGEAARFKNPRGLLAIKDKAVVSDSLNNCLREVDLSTRQTSHLAGTCRTAGFTDGPAAGAQFDYPYGLLAYRSGFLVAAWGNDAIRYVEGETVSTMVMGVIRPTCLTEMNGQVFFGTDSGLMILYPESKSAELIAGHGQTTGFSDGPLLSARFGVVRGIVSFPPALILMTDYGNHRMRLVDLASKKVSSICTGTWGKKDGGIDVCKLYRPWSVVIFEEIVYIGQAGGKIRMMSEISSPELPDACPPPSFKAALKSGDHAEVKVSANTLTLPVGHFEFHSHLPDGTLCVTIIDMIE